MVCNKYDQRRAIVLLVRAWKTGRFYTNLEMESNIEIFKYSGMVAHISGKIKDGESDEEAMRREGYEESGFDFTGKIVIPKEQTLDFSNYHGWPVSWGYAEVEEEFEGLPIDPSVQRNRWMTPSELLALSFKKREIRLEAKPALCAYLAL